MVPEDQTTILRLLTERRDDLVHERTRVLNRLHAVLRDLLPGGAPTGLSADKAAALMKGIRPITATDNGRRDIARDLLADLRRLDRQVKMGPGMIAAMTTSIVEELVLRTAEQHAVPGSVAQELLAGSRPCLHLVPLHGLTRAQQEDARPAARTGGLPVLPDGVDWPGRRKPLVLTVDCAALPHEALDIELPPEGSLLFFTDIEYEPESSVVLHVPAGASTTECSPTYELDGEPEQARVYQPDVLYPVPGLTVSPDWRDDPATSAFLDAGADRDGILDDFEDAVRRAAAGGASYGVAVQLGGFSSPWQSAPDEGDLVLLAQIHGQSIDLNVYTQTLIVGTREDIAGRRYEALEFEQQV